MFSMCVQEVSSDKASPHSGAEAWKASPSAAKF